MLLFRCMATQSSVVPFNSGKLPPSTPPLLFITREYHITIFLPGSYPLYIDIITWTYPPMATPAAPAAPTAPAAPAALLAPVALTAAVAAAFTPLAAAIPPQLLHPLRFMRAARQASF